MGALADLAAEGKIRDIGPSEAWIDKIGAPTPSIRSIPACSRRSAVDPRNQEGQVLSVLRELNIGRVA